METPDKTYTDTLEALQRSGNLRNLPQAGHRDKWMIRNGTDMLNLSSNDYLGLASDLSLRDEFMKGLSERDFLLSASSSRLLTGNFPVHDELEKMLACLFGRDGALVFSSGYHLNTGILPAVADAHTLILADKLVHASLIDGIRLSAAKCIRYRHQDYTQLQTLLEKHHHDFSRIIIVTESIFSMDGDVAPLTRLAELKKTYPNVMLYVDEAHAVGVRGQKGLGIAEEQRCLKDIDFLCGTFGKALASVGAYVVCSQTIREYLVNRMRTLIFTTALPPFNTAWTKFVLSRLGHVERAPRPARQTFAPRTASDTREWQILPVFEPHHSRGNRRKPRHHPESGGHAAQRILRPARSSAHRTGGDFPSAYLAHCGLDRRGDRPSLHGIGDTLKIEQK